MDDEPKQRDYQTMLKSSMRENAIRGIEALLTYLGEDPSRPGLLETPERFLKAWEEEWGAGYREPAKALVKLFREKGIEVNQEFDTETSDPKIRGIVQPTRGQMVLVDNILFYSHCEHHLAPFFGVAHVAYIPGPKGIVGISKLARIVEHFARRLQVQERLTMQIAEFIETNISPDCGVVIKAQHTCMSSRGVRQQHAKTITSALKGVIFSEASARAEFLALTRQSSYSCD